MIQVTKDIAIEENEIQEDFVRAFGPGGQNVNRLATAVQLRFDVRNSASLPQEVRQRLLC
jgi:ribosome-associated protein